MFSLFDFGHVHVGFRNSRPAAGAEHYMSHYMEMKLIREGRPAVLHGAKVGLFSVYAAELYARLRALDRRYRCGAPESYPSAGASRGYSAYPCGIRPDCRQAGDRTGAISRHVPEAYARLQQQIIERWDQIQSRGG